MPKAMIRVDPDLPSVGLEYFFNYNLEQSDQAKGQSEYRIYKVPPDYKITYAIKFPPPPIAASTSRPAPKFRGMMGQRAPLGPAEFLWILGLKICFDGRITAYTRQDLGDWQAGLIQSIYESERNSRYTDGSVRQFRMNTAFGPVKDGDAGSPFYGDGPHKLKHTGWVVKEDDAPNFKVPAQFGPNNSTLTETFGMDCFCTFLVLVRERDKSIIELSRIKWQINWDGVYDPGKADPGKWSPKNGANFLEVEHSDNPKLYATLNRQPGHVPFSLNLAEQEEFCEILEGGKWKSCNEEGNTTMPGKISLTSWEKSA
jgi:hypothetical protein